jgi:hypothetical protein
MSYTIRRGTQFIRKRRPIRVQYESHIEYVGSAGHASVSHVTQ